MTTCEKNSLHAKLLGTRRHANYVVSMLYIDLMTLDVDVNKLPVDLNDAQGGYLNN